MIILLCAVMAQDLAEGPQTNQARTKTSMETHQIHTGIQIHDEANLDSSAREQGSRRNKNQIVRPAGQGDT